MTKEEKKKPKKNILSWIFSIVFILIGFGFLSDSFLAGFLVLLASILIFPPITKIIKEKSKGKAKTWMFVTAFVVLVLLSGAFLSDEDTSKDSLTEKSLSDQETITQQEEISNQKNYDLEINVYELLDQFDSLTELQQEEKLKELKGKRIKTTIIAYKIDKASLSTQYVVMDDDYIYPSVKAFFPAEEKDRLLNINIGDNITFIGELVTYKGGTYVSSYVEFTKSKVV